MSDPAMFELEEDRRPAQTAGRRRLATRVMGVAVPVLLLTGILAAASHDEPRPENRVAASGGGAPALDDGVLPEGDIAVDVAPTVPSVVPVPITVPKVTVPKVGVPKLPRLPAVTVPQAPVAISPSPPTCAATPPPFSPPKVGLYEIATSGGSARYAAPQQSETTYDQDHTYSPDGSQVAFVRVWLDNDGQTPSKVYIAKSDFSGERQITMEPLGPSGLQWSPDGRHIAFFAQPKPGEHQALHLLDPLTGAVRQVSDSASGMGPGTWSPDGSWIAWASNSQGGLWVAEVATGRVTKLADEPILDQDWSPDGRQLAFGQVTGGVFVIDRDGSNRRKVHDHGARVAWSPKVRSQLVVDTHGALYRVDPDTGASSFLRGGHVQGWLPDGSRLLASNVEGIHLVDWNGCAQSMVAGRGDEISLWAWTPESKTLLVARVR